MKKKSKADIPSGFTSAKKNKANPEQLKKRDLYFYKKFLEEITTKHKLQLTSSNRVLMQFHEERPSIESVKAASNKKFEFPKYDCTEKSPLKFQFEETKEPKIVPVLKNRRSLADSKDVKSMAPRELMLNLNAKSSKKFIHFNQVKL